MIDALVFLNEGDFIINTVVTLTNNNSLYTLYGFEASGIPFMTKDTLYYTNGGFLSGEPGFQFDTGTSTFRHSANFFFNSGTVEGIDTEAPLPLYGLVGGSVFVNLPNDSRVIPSQVLVLATNIVNTGAMSVGNAGLLRLAGKNVTNTYATLAAGSVNTAGLTPDTLDTTGLQGQNDWAGVIAEGSSTGQYFFIDSPEVYDLFWGVTNALDEGLAGVDPPTSIPSTFLGFRDSMGSSTLPFWLYDYDAEWSVSAIGYTDYTGTNIWYNIVFVNTNFADTNLKAAVGFARAADPQVVFAGTAAYNPYEAIVQFAEPVYDVITRQTVTNGIYLLDAGAYVTNGAMVLSTNASAAVGSGYSRPNAFELTTETPSEWANATLIASELAITYDSTLLYAPDEFVNDTVPFDIAEYGAQIGRDPANMDGSFNGGLNAELSGLLAVNLPDPTNDAGRIEISAGNLDMTQARMRAEGMVILNATNLIGGSTAGVDWGEINATIGITNGYLTVSNLFPTTFERVRGDIYAWCANWQNTQTNEPGLEASEQTTNNVNYHILVVDQNLHGTFPSTARNLTLTGLKSVVLQDNLNVISQATIKTTNLTVNSSNYFSQNAQSFTPATTPYLKNLFLNTNGFLGAANVLDVGFNVNQGQTSPSGRTYTVNTITNFGRMMATAPLLQSAIFENDGVITSDNSGSIIIQAGSLGLGLALTNATNALYADGSVYLSGASILASNSVINAGLAMPASLTLEATGQLTDFVPGTPTTNTNSVIINHWTVTDGFSLPVKPAAGDLFGTEIHTISTNLQQVTHVWAGTDRGATPAGFVNNEVIGHLLLDRQSSNSTLRFSAAGIQNAMYVDYLELTNYAYSKYQTGLSIDPNFTIYFANCNADPQKLTAIYSQLVWVTNFAGPNSTQVVPYINSSVVCLMNAAVANSTVIAFWNGTPNYYLLHGPPPYPYLLNNPANWTDYLSCPGTYDYPCNCSLGTNSKSLLLATTNASNLEMNLLTISVKGQGTVTPVLSQSQLALGSNYTLTAKAAAGWVFSSWSTYSPSGAFTNYSPALTFAFVTNTDVTANFIPTPFPALQGAYNGLFFEANEVNPGSSGAISLTLQPSGTFSGRLLMGSSNYSFSSQFTGTGAAQAQAKSGAQTLTVNLQLDITGQTGQIQGDVNGGAWDAPLTANVTPAWTASNPSPLAGSYTMVLPWATGVLSGTSGGDSYGAGTLSKLGVLTVAGALADGTAFSVSAPVSPYGQWPFYLYAAAGKDTVLGWVSVLNGLSGDNVSWCKAAGKGPLYAGGFTNALSLTGSPWQAPAAKTPALLLASPQVILSGGGLAGTQIYDVKLQNYLTYAATNLSLSVNSTSGKFSGWFYSPGTKKKVTMTGVVLTNEGVARGYFSGTNASGAVLLQGQ